MNKNSDKNILLIAAIVIVVLVCCCIVAAAAIVILGAPGIVTTGPTIATPVVVPLP